MPENVLEVFLHNYKQQPFRSAYVSKMKWNLVKKLRFIFLWI